MLVGEAMRIEREHLLPLMAEGFELAETSFPTVDGKGCVKVRTNCYSTPLKPGTRPQAKLLPAYVEIWHGYHPQASPAFYAASIPQSASVLISCPD
jgi:hypothetical protein